MTEKQYDKDNPRFRDEFGCVNDLQTGESYLCGESGFIGDRDAGDTAIALCDLLNELADENEQLKQYNQKLYDELQETMGYLTLKSGVEKENEQLKEEIKDLNDLLARYEEKELQKE